MGKKHSHHNTIENIIIFLLTITEVVIVIIRFVILHGTDTLAYTSSALSFMLENLGKPVIVTGLQRLHCSHNTFSEHCNCNQHHFSRNTKITGSQIPAFETRSDGRENLVSLSTNNKYFHCYM